MRNLQLCISRHHFHIIQKQKKDRENRKIELSRVQHKQDAGCVLNVTSPSKSNEKDCNEKSISTTFRRRINIKILKVALEH